MNKSKLASAVILLTGTVFGLSSACTVVKHEGPPPGSTPPPTAAPAPTAATDAAATPTAYDSCTGKKCGDPCTICDPNDKTCVETAVVKQCSAALKCEQTVAQCGTATAPAPTSTAPATTYDACAGKKCGDRCKICAPGDIKCIESALIKLCQPDGKCKEATTVDCSKK
jgi:hypothetical protein